MDLVQLGEVAAALAVLWIAESIGPQLIARKRCWRHDAHNLGLGLVNAVVIGVVAATGVVAALGWGASHDVGLLQRWGGSHPWVRWASAIVLIDAWAYAWHVINHKVPVLWRFHSVHHTDEQMDATSAFRFHPGELLLTAGARAGVLLLLGVTPLQLLVYELILEPIALFHHGNVRLPERLERVLRWVIVTPGMHIVHHSDWQPETDSNYASVLSCWDRLFGTYRGRPARAKLTLGLDGYAGDETSTLGGMLRSPFRRQRSGRGAVAGADEGRGS